VAAVVCVSSAVAGEMLQDLKVGHILGGTPWRMQVGDVLGVFFASALLYFPLLVLHAGNIKAGGIGFGDRQLSAPQAGLMSMLAQGIVGGDMPCPMLFAVGMYLPLETTFAIWVGGIIRWITDEMREKRGLNDAQKARVENVGILIASGLIAGEALTGLVVAAFRFFEWKLPTLFPEPSFLGGLGALAVLGWYMIVMPLRHAGSPDEPAPPTAMM
jgi:uncharacterized oligopeptide transporter (OPT) family protein